ncbi:MAG: hypothetical protein ACLQU5_26845, partial [Isosphaeraceae bacterium]
ITSSVRTFIILSLGPALEPETTRKGVEQKKRIMPRLFSGDSLAASPPGHHFATIPMLASTLESRCADTAVIRNLTLNPSFNPLLVYQFRILSTNPSLSIATLNRYLIAT